MSLRPAGSGSPAAPGAAIADRPAELAAPPVRLRNLALVTLIVIAGYVAFLMAGFATGLDAFTAYDVRSLPLYVFCGLLLLVLQWQVIVSVNRPIEGADPAGEGTGALAARQQNAHISLFRILYTFVTSAFALVYMGQALFFRGPNNITRQPITYIALNALAILVLLSDFLYRRSYNQLVGTRLGRRVIEALDQPGQQRFESRDLTSPFLKLAVDIGGIGAFCYLAWAILWVLAALQPPYVIVDVHQLGLPGITRLQDLDLVLALCITALTLALAVMHGLSLNGTRAPRNLDPRDFWRGLLRTARVSGEQGLLSLRFVLGPLIWLIPAFSIGTFAAQTTDYFRLAARTAGSGVWDLFNPFSQSSIHNYGRGTLVIALALVAVAAVIVASVVVEHNFAIFKLILERLRDAGRGVALVLFLFLLSLAVINAVAVLTVRAEEPFQLGAATLVALMLAVLPPVLARLRTGLPLWRHGANG